ncbi:MAG: PAS domain S-box protein, partial [Candidatus Aminicenantes bacterium]|nr:PAS domain S-box protein [Candidatus Aminicenantes bacterium]
MKKLKILFVEDLPTDVEIAQREISKEKISYDHRIVETAEDYHKALSEFKPDLIISDYSMPRFDGMSALRTARAQSYYIPFIVLTGSMNEETAVACMKAGADDYVLKEKIRRLPFAVKEVLAKQKAETEKHQAQQQKKESEAQFQAIFENMASASCLDEIIYQNGKAIDYIILDVNPAYERITGEKREEVIGRKASDLYSTKDVPFLDIYVKVSETGKPTEFEAYFPPLDKFLHVTAGCPRKGYFSTVFSDITERKLNQAKIENLNSLLLAIRDVNQLIVQETDFPALLQKSCEILKETRDYQNIEISILDEADNKIKPVASSGIHLARDWAVTRDGSGNAPRCINDCLKNGTTLIIDDPVKTCSECSYFNCEFLHDTIVVPIKNQDMIVGCLTTCLIPSHHISKEEIDLLEEIAGDLGFARQKYLADKKLHQIEWMISGKVSEEDEYIADYGDLSQLNHNGIIKKYVDPQQLRNITSEYMDLMETSSAIYELNGDYALGIFASGWCQMMDKASRELCNTKDNQKALDSGKWLCHESCWKDASLEAIKKGKPVDVKCNGGIRLYAIPIRSGDKIIGAINFGYDDPPRDENNLRKLSELYKTPFNKLKEKSAEYQTRPQYMIDYAKKRLEKSALMIGNIIERKRAEENLRQSEQKYHLLVSSLNEGLMQVDNDDRILYVNQKLCNIFGYTEAELIGKIGYETLIHEEDKAELQAKNKARIEMAVERYEIRGRKKSGEIIWLSISGSALKDEDGKVIG